MRATFIALEDIFWVTSIIDNESIPQWKDRGMSTPLYAEVVFDRPLDTAYSYAVPAELHEIVGIGKRVECPFGRGDKVIAGYCVGLTNEVPTHATKELVRVLDDEALLDDHLLRLTRWMADYYLAGWGQVLHAVVLGRCQKEGWDTQCHLCGKRCLKINSRSRLRASPRNRNKRSTLSIKPTDHSN